MRLEVGCPHCPAVVRVPSSAVGRTLACCECGGKYRLPATAAVGSVTAMETIRPAVGARPVPAASAERTRTADAVRRRLRRSRQRALLNLAFLAFGLLSVAAVGYLVVLVGRAKRPKKKPN